MKNNVLMLVLLVISMTSFPLFSQVDNEVVALGLPGDNLNLYAVLDVFQKSKTIEQFERAINERESNINNLDLNNDNMVDYISVISYNQGNFHSIVLRIALDSTQFQDVAVIEVSKNNVGRVVVQIIGDEALYGKNYILEPSLHSVSETPNPGYIGSRNVFRNEIVYVDDWPIVIYLFSPSFSLYISPWYWGFYPLYWHPWTPYRYYNYWSFHHHYYNSPYYRRAPYVRFPSHYSYYLKRRTTSPVVIRNRRAGVYGNTYEGRTYKAPTVPQKMPKGEVRREIRSETRVQPEPSVRKQTNQQPSTRQQDKSSTRQSNREENRTTREANRSGNQRPQSPARR